MSNLTPEYIDEVNSLSYEQLLRRSRFEVLPTGEAGEYFDTILSNMADRTGPDECNAASRRVGFPTVVPQVEPQGPTVLVAPDVAEDDEAPVVPPISDIPEA